MTDDLPREFFERERRLAEASHGASRRAIYAGGWWFDEDRRRIPWTNCESTAEQVAFGIMMDGGPRRVWTHDGERVQHWRSFTMPILVESHDS